MKIELERKNLAWGVVFEFLARILFGYLRAGFWEDAMTVVRKKFIVEGIHCGLCAISTGMLLKTRKGVRTARADDDSKTAGVECDQGAIAVAAKNRAVDGVGLPAQGRHMIDVLFLTVPNCVQCAKARKVIEKMQLDFRDLKAMYLDVTQQPEILQKCRVLSSPGIVIGGELGHTRQPGRGGISRAPETAGRRVIALDERTWSGGAEFLERRHGILN